MLVSEVMTTRPVTTPPDASVKHAIELLAVHGVSSLPVVDVRGELRGVVSEVDLIEDLVPLDRRAHLLPVVTDPDRPRTVAEVMTSTVHTARRESDVAEVVRLFASTAVKCVPVVDERRHVVGVLSRADVVRVLARADEELERDVAGVLADLGLATSPVAVREGTAELGGAAGEDPLARAAVAMVPGVVRVSPRPPA